MQIANPKLYILYLLMALVTAPLEMYGQKNLVENAGFEKGDQIPSWHYKEIYKEHAVVVLDKDQFYRGKSSLKVSMPVAGKRAEFEQQAGLSFGPIRQHLKTSIAVKVDSGSSALALIYFFRLGKPVGTYYFKDGRYTNKDWQTFENHILMPAGVDSATINLRTYGTGSAWFDEVSVQQVNTNKKPSANVKKVINDALQFAKNTYWRRDSIDWNNVQEQAMFMASGTGENYYPAIKALMESLKDPHSYLQTSEQVQAQRAQVVTTPQLKADFPTSSILDSNIGYINVTKSQLFHPDHKKKYADTLLSQIRSLDKTYDLKGWIVDLRSNIGGFVDPMLAGLSPILDSGFVVSQLHLEKERYGQRDSIYIPSDGKWSSGGAFSIVPYWAKKPIPIAVLCGPTTASSGEIVLLAFKGRSDVFIFGEPTSGVPTGPTPFYLPDKGIFAVSAVLWCDRNGVSYSESIKPDVLILNPKKEQHFDKDPVIKAAKEWLLNNQGSKGLK
jgi:C-terminal processing protease CtpA/Prc